MHLLWSLIVGLIVGALAKLVTPGKDGGGIVVTTILGIVGSLLAGLLGRTLGIYGPGDAGPGIIASVIGAVIVLAIYNGVRRKTA